MKHKHGLKAGMTFEKPLPTEFSAVYSVAKGLGLNCESIEKIGHPSDDIWFDGEYITNRPFDSVLPKKTVTFTEFITAMMTPDKTSVTDIHGSPFQVEGKAQRGEPKEVSEKKPENFFDKESELLWKSLQKPTVECLSLTLTPKDYMSKKQYIRHLEAEVEALKQKLAEAEKKPVEDEQEWPKDIEKCIKDHLDRSAKAYREMFFKMAVPVSLSVVEHLSGPKVGYDKDETIHNLRLKVEALKQKLAEAEKKVGPEKKPVEEDRRVDFGGEVTFKVLRSDSNGSSAFIGENLAKEGDKHKVLIACEGYTFKIREDYFSGRPALEIHRL